MKPTLLSVNMRDPLPRISAPPCKPKLDLERIVRQVHKQVNAHRVRIGLPPHVWDDGKGSATGASLGARHERVLRSGPFALR